MKDMDIYESNYELLHVSMKQTRRYRKSQRSAPRMLGPCCLPLSPQKQKESSKTDKHLPFYPCDKLLWHILRDK